MPSNAPQPSPRQLRIAELEAENERLRAALHNVHGMCRLNESRHFIGTYVEEVLAVVK